MRVRAGGSRRTRQRVARRSCEVVGRMKELGACKPEDRGDQPRERGECGNNSRSCASAIFGQLIRRARHRGGEDCSRRASSGCRRCLRRSVKVATRSGRRPDKSGWRRCDCRWAECALAENCAFLRSYDTAERSDKLGTTSAGCFESQRRLAVYTPREPGVERSRELGGRP